MSEIILGGIVILAGFLSIRASLRQYAFGVWIIVAFAAAMVYPEAFQKWGQLDPAKLIVPLIQIIMFGMGTTLTPEDFSRAIAHPKPVLIGLGAQFAIMPVIGLGLGLLMDLDAQVLSGVVLVGSVSGGVASNLMAYLAGGNVALSVTMTACSTLASPVMTPLLMQLLCGAIVPISFQEMMLSILNMIIAPILAGLLANQVLYSEAMWTRRLAILLVIVASGIIVALLAQPLDHLLNGRLSSVLPGIVPGAVLVSITAAARIIAVLCRLGSRWMDSMLPLVSMAGIWIIIAIITARSRDTLMAIGVALVLTAVAHNSIGYLLGYWIGRLFRLTETDCRTVAFEVGMQNSGMAAGLAIDTLKSAPAALAPAIFGPWMNISGSMLASWWNRKDIFASGQISSKTPCEEFGQTLTD